MEINLTTINRLSKWRTINSEPTGVNKSKSDLQNTLEGVEKSLNNAGSRISGLHLYFN